jgi:hypothetical protein
MAIVLMDITDILRSKVLELQVTKIQTPRAWEESMKNWNVKAEVIRGRIRDMEEPLLKDILGNHFETAMTLIPHTPQSDARSYSKQDQSESIILRNDSAAPTQALAPLSKSSTSSIPRRYISKATRTSGGERSGSKQMLED